MNMTSTDKSKIMVIGNTKAEIYINEVQLEKDGSSTADICIRITTAKAAIAKLDRI